jgi:hypothetical protein
MNIIRGNNMEVLVSEVVFVHELIEFIWYRRGRNNLLNSEEAKPFVEPNSSQNLNTLAQDPDIGLDT